MALDPARLAKLKKLYNQCDPYEPLPPGDPRNVDLDALGGSPAGVRGEHWIDLLEQKVAFSEGPFLGLFTGLTGSGKSTELRRLAERLRAPDGLNLLPVIVDANEHVDLTAQVDVSDILVMMLYAAEVAVLRREGADEESANERAFNDGMFTRVWRWLTRLDGVRVGEMGFEVGKGVSVTAELRTRPDVREEVRAAVAKHLQAFRRRVSEEFERLEARAKAKGHAGLIVIVDSMEKLQGSTRSYWEVLDSAWQIFANGAPYLTLPVHAIHTIPSAVLKRSQLDHVMFLPMVKLFERDGARFAPGFDAMRRLVEGRIEPRWLAEIFGAPSVEPRVEALIRRSGGYPRELMLLLQDVVFEATRGPVDDAVFTKVVQRRGDAIRARVPDYAFDWAARVAHEKRLILTSEDERPMVETMLSNNVVLRYLSGGEWYDLHPAVREIPAVAQAIEALERGR